MNKNLELNDDGLDLNEKVLTTEEYQVETYEKEYEALQKISYCLMDIHGFHGTDGSGSKNYQLIEKIKGQIDQAMYETAKDIEYWKTHSVADFRKTQKEQ